MRPVARLRRPVWEAHTVLVSADVVSSGFPGHSSESRLPAGLEEKGSVTIVCAAPASHQLLRTFQSLLKCGTNKALEQWMWLV